jgi:4-carboxymuconolactone decarboxylase
MARIPLPGPDTMTPEQRRVYDAVVKGPRGVVVGPLRAAIHRPELAEKWQEFGALLRYRTSLPPRLSELAILVTARHWGSQLEWHAHVPPAREAGLAEDVIEAIRHKKRPGFANDDERAVYDYASELHARHTVRQPTYDRALGCLGTVGIVELTALIGYYTMVAMTLIAHEIPLPDGAAPSLPVLP